MPIDYSKWDHIDDASSSDDEQQGPARVTRLESPSRVTFGGDGDDVAVEAPAASRGLETRFVKAKADAECDSWTHKGDMTATPSGRRLYWSQDRYSVTFRVGLRKEESIRHLRVRVPGILPYADRFHAVGTHHHELIVDDVLEAEMPHMVHLPQDEDDVDWTVERDSGDGRYLTLTLFKAVPMQGMSIWWKQPFVGYPQIQMNQDDAEDGASATSSKSKEFLKAWEEAHQKFRDNRKAEADRKSKT